MKKILCMSMLGLLLLCGCAENDKPTTTVCKTDVETDQIEFVSEGDRLISQKEFDPYTFEELGITANQASDQEFMKEIFEAYKDLYAESFSKGITFDYKVDTEKQQVVFEINLSYKDADMKELEAAGVVEGGDSEYVSLKATVEGFESQGYTCGAVE